MMMQGNMSRKGDGHVTSKHMFLSLTCIALVHLVVVFLETNN